MKSERWIDEELTELRNRHQFRSIRSLPAAGGIIRDNNRIFINFSSNDYLNFQSRPELIKADQDVVERYGTGTGSSRLVTGSLPIHDGLEAAIARHKGYSSALLFGSGYMTNLGVISSLVGKDDRVLIDRLAHASILDATRISGAKLMRFRHNDLNHLQTCLEKSTGKSRTLIITESVFSMDGDLAPLPEIASLAASHGAMLMVDEAHATGVYGPRGGGLIAQYNLQETVNISMCTLSKGLGSYGGAVACSEVMRSWLINKARSLIYTTSLPPGPCASALAALNILEHEPHLGTELCRRGNLLRAALKDNGFDTGTSTSHIIPVIIGDNEKTLRLSAAVRDQGIIVTAIRPPTVPTGSARLRFSVTLAHDDDVLRQTAVLLASCARKTGI